MSRSESAGHSESSVEVASFEKLTFISLSARIPRYVVHVPSYILKCSTEGQLKRKMTAMDDVSLHTRVCVIATFA